MDNNKCNQCEKSFLFENTLKLHIKNIHEGGLGNSQDQPTSSTSIYPAQIASRHRHNQKKNKSSPIISCSKTVSSGFPGVSSKVQQCSKCSFKSGDSELYWAHVVVEHPPAPTAVYYCGYSYCWFPFTSLRLKEAHEVTSHGALHLPFKCVLCKKNLANKTALENHKNKCIRKPLYKCPCAPCDFQSKRFGQLSKHVDRTHQQDLLLVDKVRYTFHHPGWEKHSDCDLTTESEEIKSEEELGPSQPASGSVAILTDPRKISELKVCPVKEDIKSDEEEEIVLSGAPHTAPAPAPAPPFQCPYDSKMFPSWQHLHRHLHSSHLETGTDMVDCPLGQDSLSCICGRTTNCRDTLVVHSIRCVAIMGRGVEGQSRKEDDDDGLEKGWLVAKRRARRKCKELGMRDEDALSRTQLGMLDMCMKVSARKLDMTGKNKKNSKDIIAENDAPVFEISDDDSNTETERTSLDSLPPSIAPAKRKSALKSNGSKASRISPRKKPEKKAVIVSSGEDQSGSEVESGVSSQVRVKCPVCQRIFDRDVVMEHFCDYDIKEHEILEVSSGSEIDISEEDDSAATTVSEATSEDDTPVKTNSNMLSLLASMRNSPHVEKTHSNVVKLSTSSFSFDVTYSLPPTTPTTPTTPSTPSPSTMSRQGAKRTRAKLKSRGRKGYVPTKHKLGLQFKK